MRSVGINLYFYGLLACFRQKLTTASIAQACLELTLHPQARLELITTLLLSSLKC